MLVASCGGDIVRIRPPLPQAHRTLADACTPGDPVSCPLDVFLRGLEEAAMLYQGAEICRIDLQECRELGSIDQALCASKLQECQVKADQRWLWAIGGVLIGAVSAGLVVGLGH